MSLGVRVEGLRALRTELRRLNLENDLKDANHKVATLVTVDAKRRAATVSRMAARAAATLTASRAGVGARVLYGGARAPFAGGVEWGAVQDAPRVGPSGRRFVGLNQFKPPKRAGYFLYPAINENTERIVEIYGDEIDRITRKAFPN